MGDVNRDGLEEFVVAADEVSLTLVNSDGRSAWGAPYRTEDLITHLAIANVTPGSPEREEIIVATSSDLLVVGANQALIWRQPLTASVAALATFNADEDAAEEILVALQDGTLQLYDDAGARRWQVLPRQDMADNPRPRLTVADFDGDGQSDILISYGRERFSELARYGLDGSVVWQRPVEEGRVSALAAVPLQPGAPPLLALGTETGRLALYDVAQNRRLWFRTPSVGRTVTAITAGEGNSGPNLVLGTDGGRVLAYDWQGRRLWDSGLATTPEQRVTALAVNPSPLSDAQPFSIAVTLSTADPNQVFQADVILLDAAGNPLSERYATSSGAGLNELVDVNRDGRTELLLVDFATIQLLDPGIGAGENLRDWEYAFNSEPEAALVADVDRDGRDEMLIGGQGGRLHLVTASGEERWTRELNGRIAHLAVIPNAFGTQSAIVVVHNNRQVGVDNVETFSGRIELLRPDGRPMPNWNGGRELPTTITSLLVHDIRGGSSPAIIAGTIDGRVAAYAISGERYWETTLNGSVEFLHPLSLANNGRIALLAGSQARQLHLISNKGRDSLRANYFQPIVGLADLGGNESTAALVIAIGDGTLRGLDAAGTPLWEAELDAVPTQLLTTGEGSFVIATDENEVLQLTETGGQERITWRLGDLGRVTALFWGDLDNDDFADLAVGNREGEVRLYAAEDRSQWDAIDLGSSVFYISAMRRDPDQPAELAIVTNNGVLQHFRAQANRPPLLVNPQVDVAAGRYSVAVTLINLEENDEVSVTLEVFDPESNSWQPAESRFANANQTLFWQLTPSTVSDAGLRYRFRYDDGTHQGHVEPTPGPAPIFAADPGSPWPGIITVGIILTIAGAFLFAQRRTLDARVGRFYQRVRQQAPNTLQLVDVVYTVTNGSPDYLLNLASRARQDGNRPLASLADGLFLLADRPEAALPILSSALEDAETTEPAWRDLPAWQALIQTGEALFQAPTITELSLLRPRLVRALEKRPSTNKPLISMEALVPILTSVRDSERVDLVEDRLVYLNEARIQLRQLLERIDWSPLTVERALLTGVAERWSGLIKSEMELLRGQARLSAELKTKRIVPSERAVVALDVVNQGRAPAEQIQVVVLDDPAYTIIEQPEVIPILPAGRTRQAIAVIQPKVDDRFRLACEIHFEDSTQAGKSLPFGDMIYLLTPQRAFEPLRNPYAPGTPLRRNSLVFVGRQDVFEFIRETTSRRDQQNILILVGQRRTGKTSMLLRLGQHLGDDLLPVYIDCQSLGVVEGIGAFFHDIAWLIADALAERDLTLAVPPLTAWQENPARYFQRQFIPAARALLPEDTRLLLVFDEFEAFEDLVKNELLPPTLFTYLRHLMQHEQGLSFVFVGTRRLEEMTADYWSVLFNIALYKQIGFLSRESATKLITQPVAPNLLYDDLALDKIWRVTAGHPYFLQLVCYALVNQANKKMSGYVTISDVNGALDDMLRLGEVHFAYMWQLSSQTERLLLTAVAHHIDPDAPFHPLDLVQYLEQYGVRLQPAEITQALDHLVQRDIMRRLTSQGATLYELRIGLIGIWTAQNKSLSRIYGQGESNGSVGSRRTRPRRTP